MMKKQESTESNFNLDPEKIKESATHLAEEAAELIRKHPFETVGVSLLAGILIGMFINRK